MADLVTAEGKAVLPGEGLHLRRHHRPSAAAPQARQIRVVDDALGRRAAPERQRLVQKAFHREAVEAAIELQIPPFAVAQIKHAGDQALRLVRQTHLEGAGVVLHLRARLVGHAVATARRRLADPVFTQPAPKRGIGHGNPVLLGQFLVDALHPAVAFLVQPAQQFGVQPDFVASNRCRRRPLPGDDAPHRVAANRQTPRDLPQAHPLPVQQEDRLAHVRFDHGFASLFSEIPRSAGAVRRPAAAPGRETTGCGAAEARF